MVLYTLINISIDVSASITLWVLKNTLYGTYYLTTYFIYSHPEQTKEELEIIELRREINHLNRKLHFIDSINNNPNIVSLTNNQTIPNEQNLEKSFIFIDDSEL